MASERDNESDATVERAGNLFDLRRIIGGVFALYGVILTVLGIGASDESISKAAGINVNLWTGLGMLVVAAIFLVWAFTRPLGTQIAESSDEGGRGAGRDRDRSGDDDAGRQ
jgi:predicted histidine transporter YuiF (NhaC family)